MQEGNTDQVCRSAATPKHKTSTLPFDMINTPGAYICNWSGQLLRIPERTIVPGEALKLNIVGQEPLLVTKISNNPGVSLTEARSLAADMGVPTGF